jgi:hypothetical protein
MRGRVAHGLVGALAGSLVTTTAYALLSLLTEDGAALAGGSEGLEEAFVAGTAGLGALLGTSIGVAMTGAEVARSVGGAAKGVAAGVAVVVALGLADAARHGPKLGEARKVVWLLYGVPAGGSVGGVIG